MSVLSVYVKHLTLVLVKRTCSHRCHEAKTLCTLRHVYGEYALHEPFVSLAIRSTFHTRSAIKRTITIFVLKLMLTNTRIKGAPGKKWEKRWRKKKIVSDKIDRMLTEIRCETDGWMDGNKGKSLRVQHRSH